MSWGMSDVKQINMARTQASTVPHLRSTMNRQARDENMSGSDIHPKILDSSDHQ